MKKIFKKLKAEKWKEDSSKKKLPKFKEKDLKIITKKDSWEDRFDEF